MTKNRQEGKRSKSYKSQRSLETQENTDNPQYDWQDTNKLDIDRKAILDLYAQAFASFGNRIVAIEILTHNFHLRVTELEQRINQLNERVEELIKRFNESLIATRRDLINILKIINDDTSRTA